MPVPPALLQTYADTIVKAAAHEQDIHQWDVDEEFEIVVPQPTFELTDGDVPELREMIHGGALAHGLALQYLNEHTADAGFRIHRKVAVEPYAQKEPV